MIELADSGERSVVKEINDNISGCDAAKLVAVIKGLDNISFFYSPTDGRILMWGDEDIDKVSRHFISLLSLIRQLEDERYIYEVRRDDIEHMLYYGGKCYFTMGYDRERDVYTAERGTIALSGPYKKARINGQECRGVFFIEGLLAADLGRLLASKIYPTSGLQRFVKNGFRSDEERRFLKTTKLTHISLIIALLALAASTLSPMFSTCYSNHHGYSTIKKEQFDSIYNIIQEIILTGDTDTTKAYSKPGVQKFRNNKNDRQ